MLDCVVFLTASVTLERSFISWSLILFFKYKSKRPTPSYLPKYDVETNSFALGKNELNSCACPWCWLWKPSTTCPRGVGICWCGVCGLYAATRKSRPFLSCIIPGNLIFPSEFAWEQMTARAERPLLCFHCAFEQVGLLIWDGQEIMPLHYWKAPVSQELETIVGKELKSSGSGPGGALTQAEGAQ